MGLYSGDEKLGSKKVEAGFRGQAAERRFNIYRKHKRQDKSTDISLA